MKGRFSTPDLLQGLIQSNHLPTQPFLRYPNPTHFSSPPRTHAQNQNHRESEIYPGSGRYPVPPPRSQSLNNPSAIYPAGPNSNPVLTEQNSRPSPTGRKSNPAPTKGNSNPAPTEGNSYPAPTKGNSNPVLTGRNSNPAPPGRNFHLKPVAQNSNLTPSGPNYSNLKLSRPILNPEPPRRTTSLLDLYR